MKNTIRSATESEISLFKEIKMLAQRNLTGNPFNCIGSYNELLVLNDERIQVTCEITLEDVLNSK